MTDQEQKTLQSLSELNQLLKAQTPPVSIEVNGWVEKLLIEADRVFRLENCFDEKLKYAKWLQSAWGGMGGLFIYYPISEECFPKLRELYDAVQDLLKSYSQEV